jgi:hypothetical protein
MKWFSLAWTPGHNAPLNSPQEQTSILHVLREAARVSEEVIVCLADQFDQVNL